MCQALTYPLIKCLIIPNNDTLHTLWSGNGSFLQELSPTDTL